MPRPWLLFTDGSFNPITKIGFAAFLALPAEELFAASTIAIRTKSFTGTTAARLELQAWVWAMEEIEFRGQSVTSFTDSQTLLGLPDRRRRLEERRFLSKAGVLLKNHDLYQQFYEVADRWKPTLIKLEGHSPKSAKTEIDQAFARVDQAARRALREFHPA
ncbi:MAG: hypothetical protein SynsKO_40300 [Synoicihabitans sp.]